MSTAIWQIDRHLPGQHDRPILFRSKDASMVRPASQFTIHCRRDHQPTFDPPTDYLNVDARSTAIDVLSLHLRSLDTWVGVFENRDVLSPEYMDRVALPFHESQWYEISMWRSGASIDHPGVDRQHRLIAKCIGIKDTTSAMETGVVPHKNLSQLSTWVWWVIMALIMVVATVVAFL
jgi:hypothetical protein